MRPLLAASCVLTLALATACARDAAPGPGADLRDLCNALGEGVGLDAQESAFLDRAHDGLHDLAGRVTERDPRLGADLLEAKQRVEEELDDAREAIPEDGFRELLDAANAALEEIDAPEVSC